LPIRDRIALVQQLNDCLTHAGVVAEGLCGTAALPPLSLHQAAAQLQAAIRDLEQAARALDLRASRPREGVHQVQPPPEPMPRWRQEHG
jgi:hypothetical protein